MARFDTAVDILNDVAVEVGLASVSDPFASQNALWVQLVRLLKTAGRDLVSAREGGWQHLVREATITTQVGDTGVYAVPSDYVSLTDQTARETTNQRLLSGPRSAQEWQYLKASGAVSVYPQFRIAQSQVWLWPQPPQAGLVVRFEYRSRNWVQSSGATAPDRDAPTASSDTLLFDPHLLSRALILRWKEAKGLDTSAALADYQRALDSVIGQEPGKVLPVGGPRATIAGPTVPDGGWVL